MDLLESEPRLIEASGDELSSAHLRALRSPMLKWLDTLTPGLLVLLCWNTVPEVVMILAALRLGRPVMLLDGREWSGRLEGLARAYRPAAIAAVDGSALAVSAFPVTAGWRRVEVGGLEVIEAPRDFAAATHDELALCIMTSGSLAQPKCVRLSRTNLHHNWTAIAARLGIDASHRAPTSLSLAHSYGLSVLGSHLLAGAGVLVTSGGPLTPGFWPAIAKNQVTSLAAVPYQYRKILRMRSFREILGRLDYATVAGGPLDQPTAEAVSSIVGAGEHAGLWLMYGQTEATARIAMLAPDDFRAYGAAAGRVIDGGAVHILDADGRECERSAVGEIVYRGPNVMMGYAVDAADLSRGKDVERLHTGDSGFVDGNDILHVVGRAASWTKVAGLRISLESIEAFAAGHSGVDDAAACSGAGADLITLVLETSAEAEDGGPLPRELHREICQATGLPHDCVAVRIVERLPRVASGKVNRALVSELASDLVESGMSHNIGKP